MFRSCYSFILVSNLIKGGLQLSKMELQLCFPLFPFVLLQKLKTYIFSQIWINLFPIKLIEDVYYQINLSYGIGKFYQKVKISDLFETPSVQRSSTPYFGIDSPVSTSCHLVSVYCLFTVFGIFITYIHSFKDMAMDFRPVLRTEEPQTAHWRTCTLRCLCETKSHFS